MLALAKLQRKQPQSREQVIAFLLLERNRGAHPMPIPSAQQWQRRPLFLLRHLQLAHLDLELEQIVLHPELLHLHHLPGGLIHWLAFVLLGTGPAAGLTGTPTGTPPRR